MIQLSHELVTQFHRELATTEWLKACATIIESRIRANPAFQTAEGVGTVSSDFSEERWMSRPGSVLKYQFDVEVQVSRREPVGETDTYSVRIEYDPDQRSFQIQGEESCYLWEERQAADQLQKTVHRMLSGDIPLQHEFPCPICGGTVHLSKKESNSHAYCDGCGIQMEMC